MKTDQTHRNEPRTTLDESDSVLRELAEEITLKAHNTVATAIKEASKTLEYLPRKYREEFHQDIKDLALEYHDHGI